MRYGAIAVVVLCVAFGAFSCKAKKEMSLQDYAVIELEVNLPNPELDKAKVEGVAQKYGFTYEQYKEMYDKVEKDPKLKEQLGELRMREQNKDKE